MSTIVIDTSAIIAVIGDEPIKARLIELTKGTELVVPPSVHWEIGNAFSAAFKQKRISLARAKQALAIYAKIPLRVVDVDMADALEIAESLRIYAYDAYLIACAEKQSAPLLTLDGGQVAAARSANIDVLEV